MPKSDVLKSYDQPPVGGKPGEVEAWAMMQAALRMKGAIERGDMEEIIGAVRLNWRMWTIFQAELLDPESPVPMNIRSNVLSLANFVDKQTVAFMAERELKMLDVLISINRELSAGLYASPPPDADTQTQTGAADATKPSDVDAGGTPADDAPPTDTSVKISI